MEKILTPLEKARAAKVANQQARLKAAEETKEAEETQAIEETKKELFSEPLTPITPKQKESSNYKLEDVIKKIPMIEECSLACEFIMENFNLHQAYKWFKAKRAEEINKAAIYKIFEHHGIPRWSEDNVAKLYSYTSFSNEDIETICRYLSVNDIKFDRKLFIIKQ